MRSILYIQIIMLILYHILIVLNSSNSVSQSLTICHNNIILFITITTPLFTTKRMSILGLFILLTILCTMIFFYITDLT